MLINDALLRGSSWPRKVGISLLKEGLQKYLKNLIEHEFYKNPYSYFWRGKLLFVTKTISWFFRFFQTFPYGWPCVVCIVENMNMSALSVWESGTEECNIDQMWSAAVCHQICLHILQNITHNCHLRSDVSLLTTSTQTIINIPHTQICFKYSENKISGTLLDARHSWDLLKCLMSSYLVLERRQLEMLEWCFKSLS